MTLLWLLLNMSKCKDIGKLSVKFFSLLKWNLGSLFLLRRHVHPDNRERFILPGFLWHDHSRRWLDSGGQCSWEQHQWEVLSWWSLVEPAGKRPKAAWRRRNMGKHCYIRQCWGLYQWRLQGTLPHKTSAHHWEHNHAWRSDDIPQNPGYYDISAQDVSVWHVPNNEQLKSWTSSAILRYHTESQFLTEHGGNLYHLFKVNHRLQHAHTLKRMK